MQFAFGKFDFYNCNEPPRSILSVCNVKKTQVQGRSVFTLTPLISKATTNVTTTIFYLHGGAYVQGFVKQHWTFLAGLVAQTSCTIIAPDYPLAPTHTYLDSFSMINSVYKEMIQPLDERCVVLMGDSAGGGLALAFAQQLHVNHLHQPATLILLCPWLDITLKNPEVEKLESSDPFLSARSLRRAGKVYIGNSDPEDFMVSPINGPFQALGEISIFIGSHDILVADTRKLKALADDLGVRINYREYQGMVHMWMLLNFPESKQARQEIADLILSASRSKCGGVEM